MLNTQTPHSGLKLPFIWLAIAGVFCTACLILSALMPVVNFDAAVQSTANGTAVVVKHANGDEDIQPGDIIEAIGGKPIHTKAALYYHFLNSESDEVELTIRRTGSRIQRPMFAQELAHGALPTGLTATDRPAYILEANGTYTALENIDLTTLRSVLENKGGSASVIFKRQEEILTGTVKLHYPIGRTFATALVFLLIALMGVAIWKNKWPFKSGNPVWANLTLALGIIGILTLGLWSLLLNMPLLSLIGIIGLTLFKVVDLDYHINQFGVSKKLDMWARIALYIGPVITLLFPIWFCLSEFPVMWGADVDSNIELRLESLFILPVLWTTVYTIIDGGVIIARRRRNPTPSFQPYELGVLFACFLSIFVIALIRTDPDTAQWFLMSIIAIQAISNVIPAFKGEDRSSIQFNDAEFSPVPVREAFKHAQDLFGESWLVQVVIDRPSPKHMVSLSLSNDESNPSGLEVSVLPETWRDFLEMIRIEDSYLNGENNTLDSKDPVRGVANQLGIIIAMPIAENVSGSLTNLTLMVSTPQPPDSSSPLPVPPRLATKHQKLSELISEFSRHAPSMVYLSAEMSLEYIGDDLNAIAKKAHKIASQEIAVIEAQIRSSTPTPTDIPHGLIDEEDTEETEAERNLQIANEQYESKVNVLKSQVMAMFSQQMRSLNDIEFTKSQKLVLEDMEDLDPPMLFIGEQGTGKHLLALTAHQARTKGPFLTVDAADAPESIFALDMFGDGINPGMIQNAAGGSLFIQNADRVSNALLADIVEAVNKQPIEECVDLYLSVNIPHDAFSVARYHVDPQILPQNFTKLASMCDAEIVVLDPIRDQKDINVVADYFRQKLANLANKIIESFTPDAMRAIRTYPWPGNFNELRSVIERAIMRCQHAQIDVSDLGRDFETHSDSSQNNMNRADVLREQVHAMQSINEKLQDQVDRLSEKNKELESELTKPEKVSDDPEIEDMLQGSYAEIERKLLQKLLNKYHDDPERAAEALSLNRSRFYNKLTKYQLID